MITRRASSIYRVEGFDAPCPSVQKEGAAERPARPPSAIRPRGKIRKRRQPLRNRRCRPKIIEAENLTKVYKGKIKAVEGISFSVDEGEIFGFLGPNGAGKTTTIKMLNTLASITEGESGRRRQGRPQTARRRARRSRGRPPGAPHAGRRFARGEEHQGPQEVLLDISGERDGRRHPSKHLVPLGPPPLAVDFPHT